VQLELEREWGRFEIFWAAYDMVSIVQQQLINFPSGRWIHLSGAFLIAPFNEREAKAK